MMQRKRAARGRKGTAEAVLAEGRGRPAHVGLVLRRAREYLRLSLREVERRTGRSNAYLSQIERGLIKQPDPVVLLELADLYRLDFMTLAQWAGWAERERRSASPSRRIDAGSHLVRRVLELNETHRTELLRYIEKMLRSQRT
jgi:transcriptional regulator with XRE-family HTH domain